MSRNYLDSDEFRRDDIAFVEAMDRRAERRAARQVAEAAEMTRYEGLGAHLKAMAARCDAKTGGRDAIALGTLHSHGGWTIGIYAYRPVRVDKAFHRTALAEALAAANAWLDTDEDALLNLTLGLTADGRLA